jgi:hypothetical protein
MLHLTDFGMQGTMPAETQIKEYINLSIGPSTFSKNGHYKTDKQPGDKV